MAELRVDGDVLTLALSRVERLEGFSGDLRTPLASVAAVRATDNPWAELRGIRAPGTGIPGVIAVGTRRGSFGKDFAVVHGRGRGVVVELIGQEFERIVISAPDPEAEVARIAGGADGTPDGTGPL